MWIRKTLGFKKGNYTMLAVILHVQICFSRYTIRVWKMYINILGGPKVDIQQFSLQYMFKTAYQLKICINNNNYLVHLKVYLGKMKGKISYPETFHNS